MGEVPLSLSKRAPVCYETCVCVYVCVSVFEWGRAWVMARTLEVIRHCWHGGLVAFLMGNTRLPLEHAQLIYGELTAFHWPAGTLCCSIKRAGSFDFIPIATQLDRIPFSLFLIISFQSYDILTQRWLNALQNQLGYKSCLPFLWGGWLKLCCWQRSADFHSWNPMRDVPAHSVPWLKCCCGVGNESQWYLSHTHMSTSKSQFVVLKIFWSNANFHKWIVNILKTTEIDCRMEFRELNPPI